MKTKNIALNCSILGAACAGAVMLTASSASAQNLFVANYTTDDIYSVSPSGTSTVFATGQDYPFGIAFNSSGDLFVANTGNDAGGGHITEITPGGAQSTFYSGIDPKALAFNSAGNLFEADYNSGIIYEYTPGGVQSTFATGLSKPNAMAFDSAGNLFVANNNGGALIKITPTGVESTFATGLLIPSGLAFNSAGDLFESDNTDNKIYEFTPSGVQSTFATVTSPGGLTFDSAGNLYVASTGSVIEIAPNGTQSTFTTIAGSPTGIAFAPVPEPSVLALAAVGGSALIIRRRKQ